MVRGDSVVVHVHILCLGYTKWTRPGKIANHDSRAIRGILRCPNSNINIVDPKSRTPLFFSSLQGHNQAVGVLLADPKIDVNIGMLGDGANAFSIASEKSHFPVMKQLIDKANERETNEVLNNGWCSDNWTPKLVLCKETTVTESTTPAPGGDTGKIKEYTEI